MVPEFHANEAQTTAENVCRINLSVQELSSSALNHKRLKLLRPLTKQKSSTALCAHTLAHKRPTPKIPRFSPQIFSSLHCCRDCGVKYCSSCRPNFCPAPLQSTARGHLAPDQFKWIWWSYYYTCSYLSLSRFVCAGPGETIKRQPSLLAACLQTIRARANRCFNFLFYLLDTCSFVRGPREKVYYQVNQARESGTPHDCMCFWQCSAFTYIRVTSLFYNYTNTLCMLFEFIITHSRSVYMYMLGSAANKRLLS